MSSATQWAVPTPNSKYGLAANAPASPVATPLHSVAGPSPADAMAPWHVDSPLFWFGAIAAATFGLLAVSTSVRVGPIRVSGAVGD